MRDRIIPEQSEVTQAPAPVTRRHSLIPTHAVMTLKKWDDYRATERARFSAIPSGELDADGTPMEPGYVVRNHLEISDFPTPERLAELARGEQVRLTLWQKFVAIVHRLFGKQ